MGRCTCTGRVGRARLVQVVDEAAVVRSRVRLILKINFSWVGIVYLVQRKRCTHWNKSHTSFTLAVPVLQRSGRIHGRCTGKLALLIRHKVSCRETDTLGQAACRDRVWKQKRCLCSRLDLRTQRSVETGKVALENGVATVGLATL